MTAFDKFPHGEIFSPIHETREYRKLFVISVEGDVTESHYFRFFQSKIDSVVFKLIVIPPKSKSDPHNVFNKLQPYFDTPFANKNIEFWMVIDRDQWQVSVLTKIVEKCKQENVGLCVSNPAFPFWLLLHFEKGKGIKPSENNPESVKFCESRIREKRYLPNFSKRLTREHLEELYKRTQTAITNAKELNQPPCEGFPSNQVGTTVYRLVERLIFLVLSDFSSVYQPRIPCLFRFF